MSRTDTRPPFALLDKGLKAFPDSLVTPAFIIDEKALTRNARVMGRLAEETGCRILLAQKAFSNYDFYPIFAGALDGTEASGLYEARLGRETLPDAECHVFCAAYRDDEFDELLKYADHIVFNSPGQLARFGAKARRAGKSIGLRINPEKSTQEGHAIYDPCAPGSRLGTTREQWDRQMTPDLVELLDGLHFHTLCEQDSGPLAETLAAVEEKFGDVLPRMKWLNFGGGHHITRPGYDLGLLKKCIRQAQQKWGVTVYLEPGEAWALNAGYLAARVLDITENGGVKTAVLDTSAACHMPDVLEMPYRPPLICAGEPGEKAHTYRLAGPTCLAGDVIGDYSFDEKLAPGSLLLFGDMAIYTTCKTNTFNGMPLPAIISRKKDGTLVKVKTFGYEDFRTRLGS
ncbi:MAG: carboxynorspermidine decarboxylase [Lachnospiraceae bacterium]|jgi:carboxynorspermidine decarboxylase|nr:carboxynorspermidine decarboxylase [Lachnospiraceae bacterium]MCH4070165.1 carboxynorspermidine decarboxylase [Lachnospiraceae bacterium]MCH4108483.1 carboxynorspermidine decarboxylase [Lachnospiraceae bacterium]MCI1302502.1 carboxynorspermidine decarboxylase [Lachnospiraceae bacterium]MCI1331675.1 carboxynorspermidine decarboxylase [Lachnospiraceae bacterium]